MKNNVKLVKVTNSGMLNPVVTTYFETNNEYDIKFYTKNGKVINTTNLGKIGVPLGTVVKEPKEIVAFSCTPKMFQSVVVKALKGDEEVLSQDIGNTPFHSIVNKIKINFYRQTQGNISSRKHKLMSMFVPKSRRQKFYNEYIKNKVGHLNNYDVVFDPNNIFEYNYWINYIESFSDVEEFSYNPLISIVIPVYNCPIKYLRKCIDSCLNQTYQNFEVCLCDDASTDSEVVKVLKEYEAKDSRIKVVYSKENGHISAATNKAIEIATGEYIAFMDNDDELSPYALSENVKVLNENRDTDLIYSDEDKMDLEGNRMHPAFKPGFAPELLLGLNYICHFVVIKKTLLDEIGGLRVGFEGVQDHDMLLRATEKTNNIVHIPKILYHWRMIPGSTAVDNQNKSYLVENGKRMVEEALVRRGLSGKVETAYISSSYRVSLDNENEKVSIVIPTRDGKDILETCLKSVYEKSTYKNFEIIVVDNGSEKEETLKLFEEYKTNHDNFRVLRLDCEFNYSYLNNEAVKIAEGEYVILLNNDIEVITPSWIENMLGQARQKEIGAVGAYLLYPTNTTQHVGVVSGVGGSAGHVFMHAADGDARMQYWGSIVTNYTAVTAACLMIKKSKFEEVGGLDEVNLKVAFNDIDFCLRVEDAGYRNVIEPNARLYHYESISRGSDESGEKLMRFYREVRYMRNTHFQTLGNDRFYNDNFSYKYPHKLRSCTKAEEQKHFREQFDSKK